MTDVIRKIADDLRLKAPQVQTTVELLKQEAPAAFIARYRKDATGGLDEARIRTIHERFTQLTEMEQRRAQAIKAISAAGKMTPELQAKLDSTENRAELEDLYMPFRARRRARSTAAKQKGLDPLADLILKQHQKNAGTAVVAATAPTAGTEAGTTTGTEAGTTTGTEAGTTTGTEAGATTPSPEAKPAEAQAAPAAEAATPAPVETPAAATTPAAPTADASPAPAAASPEPQAAPAAEPAATPAALDATTPLTAGAEAGTTTGTEAGATAVSSTAEQVVKPFINPEKSVKDMADALAGARDIIAERIAECAVCRKLARDLLLSEGKLITKAREGIDLSKGRYAAYAQFAEPVSRVSLHKLMGAMRGAAEKQLTLLVEAPREKIVQQLKEKFLTNPDAVLKPELVLAIEECYDRLLGPALDNELRQDLKRRVDLETLAVCTRNLHALLMQAPLRSPVLAIEATAAGLRVAVLDASGKLLTHATLNPEKGADERKAAGEALLKLLSEHSIKTIAIGSGTGSREADLFVREALKSSEQKDVSPVMVYMHGTIQTVREDLSDIDATARGAVLIGRRLQDPLSELCKIDASTLNLAQYQHDVDPVLFKQHIDEVFESCVSDVGVDVNAAPATVLRYVAGIGAKQASPVIEARKAKGGFKSREDLKDMAGCTPKTFEYCAGFVRITDSANALDNTAIHPEAYAVVESMAASVNTPVKDLLGKAELIDKIELAKFQSESYGEHALREIVSELKQPGRDPRGAYVKPEFSEEVHDVKDLKDGMVLSGVVTNLTAFGAFVDVGVYQDGLVHISAITHKFIRDASEILTVGQRVKVKVLSVDTDRKRISLSIKDLEPQPKRQPRPRPAAATSAPRPPRPPRPEGAPQGAPATAEGAAAASRPPRRDRSGPPRDRRPRPDSSRPATAPASTTGASSTTPAAAGAPAEQSAAPAARPTGARPEGRRDRFAGAGAGRRGEGGRGDRGEHRGPPVKPVEPGKPDYSKFFVRSKRKERTKTAGPRNAEGASRDEVREVMHKQQSGGTSLADLLRKAGVGGEEGKQ
ncbi:MAG TPA: Tex-like N-terminal domain-containing protein [Planctomycetota bacterium]